MATKEKVKKKNKKHTETPEVVPVTEERPSSAHSQISVKEAHASVDNTEKFTRDENSSEKDVDPSRTEKDVSVDKKEAKSDTQDGKKEKDKKKKKAKDKDKSKSDDPGKNSTVSERTPDPELQKRSPSPFRKNAVEPVPGSNLGSAVSLKSNTSTVKEAWTDRSDAGSMFSAVAAPSAHSSVVSVKEAARENRVYSANNQGRDGSKEDEYNEDDEMKKNAYIPYLYAKKCIAKIMTDMRNMKAQFNIFVLSLRKDYKDKVSTFRQVIDVHRAELDSKETYWNEMLESLAERNNRLLKEKKVLLMQNKETIERMEKEKIIIQTELTQKLDKATASLQTAEKEAADLKTKEDDKDSEVKILKDELEKDKTEIEKLREELNERDEKLKLAAAAAVVSTAETPSQAVPVAVAEEPVKKEPTVLVTAAAVSGEEKTKMSEERNDMEIERQKILVERNQAEEERGQYSEERKKWLLRIEELQQEVSVQTKESAEWKAKYEALSMKSVDSDDIMAKYKTLEAQYNALSVVVAASEGSQVIAEENKKKTEEDKDMMSKEKNDIDNQIQKWESQFKKKNGREPSDDDKSDSVKELYVQQDELNTMVTSLETKLETYQKLGSGQVPDPPEVVPTPSKDPEVQIVEVKVADPMIADQLEKALAEIERLRAQVLALQNENTEMSSKISHQNEELSNQRDRIAQLEAELAALKAGGLVATATVTPQATEELEELKKENKALKKDMKKLLKKMEKEEEKVKSANMNPDERVSNLEEKVTKLDDKVTDLEAENDTLKEDKGKLETEKLQVTSNVQPEIATATALTATAAVTSSTAEECTVPGHADLIQQLEQKKLELEDKERQLLDKDRQIEEKVLTIQDKEKEIEKMKIEVKEMRKDMMKMAKQHAKLQAKLKDLEEFEKTKKLLKAVAAFVHEIHSEVQPAAEGVNVRLEAVSTEVLKLKEPQDKSQKAYNAWAGKFQQKHGRDPTPKDRDAEGEKLYKILEENTALVDDKKINQEALKIMKTGDYQAPEIKKEVVIVEDSPVEHMEQQMSALDMKVTDLETENDDLKKEKNDALSKVKEMELQLQQMKGQLDLQTSLSTGYQETDELSGQITELQKQLNSSESALLQEKNAHNSTKDELDNLRKQIQVLKEEVSSEREDMKAKIEANKTTTQAEIKAKEEEIKNLQSRNDQLETERLANVPVDTAKEIKNLQEKIALLEKEKSSSGTASAALQAQISEMKTKLEGANKNQEAQRASIRELEAKNKNAKADKDKAVKETTIQIEKREQQRANEDKKRIATLEKKIKELEAGGVKPGVAVAAGAKGGAVDKGMKDQLMATKRENAELNNKIKQLEMEIKRGSREKTTVGAEDKNEQKRKEKILKELEKKYEIEKNRTAKLDENLKTTEEELKVTKKVLRKKYYNMVEDMKGKIRVYCRARPLSKTETERGNYSVLKSPDEYSINVETSQRGTKEFQFDTIFMEDSTQEKVFEDTNNLVQSAVDGYNVCIFAYGQTGSGKTFTMIGDRDGNFPGIAPRAFNRIFDLIHEQRNKFTITVTSYMLELYNDKLIDLYAKPGTSDDEKMEIKKDKKGLVFIQGSVIKEASNAKELYALFDEGSKNRHTASTKMNAESSRSHLIIGIVLESINKTTGQVLKGKLSLVDLAGSERVAKTGATAEQLKEAMSINKSLSALGDVISALSSEQQFIPYRNNKLTMLMQDSLGGNAKTLMFVNISPADYNAEETVISLMYASRVKLITNDATKNADNKEIARLKNVRLPIQMYL
ncbi:hypothetical protein FSP39_000498 [Pinctada imbricata]|uniref:Kinesin motor domain-containing protein n=1 Tax=Pinctada imbricata TaxID=66713 RepID=A0AA88YB46_PINIB|nr:hypothetical protein FSP39_000498 [Pinctada imbricata]